MTRDAAVPIATRELARGEPLQIYLYHPGVSAPPVSVEQIRDFIVQPQRPWFDAAGREEVERGLNGQLRALSNDHYILGLIGSRIAGAVWYQVSRRTPEVGTLGYVYTAEDQRGLGISTILNLIAVEHFRAGGGICLYLGTVNPVAYRVYERCGFAPYNGIVMRYVAPSHQREGFDATFFGYDGAAQVRLVEWGDAGMIDALYASPYPYLIRDYRRRSFSHPTIRQQSCHIFPSIMAAVEKEAGVFLALETRRGRLVGAGFLSRFDAPIESHAGIVDFVVQPAYMAQATDLLGALVREARVLGCQVVRANFASCDTAKQEAARATGFVREAVLPRQFQVGDNWWDLEVYSTYFDDAGR
jgi:GNAT superfamily N-acetyltransferase